MQKLGFLFFIWNLLNTSTQEGLSWYFIKVNLCHKAIEYTSTSLSLENGIFFLHRLYWNFWKVRRHIKTAGNTHCRDGNMWRVRFWAAEQAALCETHQVNLFLTLDCTGLEGMASAPLQAVSLALWEVTDRLWGRAVIGCWNLLICLHQSSPVRWHACKINVINLSSQSVEAALMGVLQQDKILLSVFRKKWTNFTCLDSILTYCRRDLKFLD